MKRSILAVFVFGAVFAGSTDASHAADFATDASGSTEWAQNVQGQVDGLSNDVGSLYQANSNQDIAIQAAHDFNNDQQQDIMQNRNDINNLKNDTTRQFDQVNNYVQSVDQARADGDVLLGNQIQKQQGQIDSVQQQAHDAWLLAGQAKQQLANLPTPKDGVDGKDGDKGDTGAQGIAGVAGTDGKDGVDGKNGIDGINGKNGVDGKNGIDGINGKDGKNGVTSIITNVDTATQKQVVTNAQDLQAAKQTLQAMNNNTNQQFKSLRDEVDNNKKQANAGISGAMAMAGLPQVQTNKKVMFSAGAATYQGESALAVGASVNFNSNVIAKVSFSDDTANDMGASVGVGIGF